jgi:ABC-type transport system involved in multi-copper enzyme maturation permease subunit
VVVRLVYTHLWHLRRTSLFKISAAVGLLFPLALVLITRLVDDPRILFQPQGAGAVPVIVSACIFPIPPLAIVIACLAVGNEFVYGTRRAYLARGLTRSQAIVSESISLVGLIGALLIWLMGACAIIGAAVGATLPPGAVILAIGVGVLAAAVYAGIVQLGAAAGRSGLGAVLTGLGFLAADWVAFFAPTASMNPSPILEVVPYTVMAMVYGLVSGQPTLTSPSAPTAAPSGVAVGLLTGLALGAHGLAILIARWRDG